ncbi:protein dead ringer isoform X8 [Euwallacea fornicatus]|uniref:protein dead ringer isoform X8 n=1 Tax=Euwallacea fornicatus TaxID=995702 RepID=UPI00338F90A0
MALDPMPPASSCLSIEEGPPVLWDPSAIAGPSRQNITPMMLQFCAQVGQLSFLQSSSSSSNPVRVSRQSSGKTSRRRSKRKRMKVSRHRFPILQYGDYKKLYELSDDPKRKEFLDELFLFKQKRGSPINRLPIMAKSVLDLFELYNLVIARGGLVDVINKKLWQEIIKGLHLPSSITSAAFTLRTQYMKYLYEYECEKRNLSTQAELQAAIDGNRREGRRGSYGHFDGMPRYGFEPPNPIPLNPLTLAQAAAHQQQMVARVNPAMSTGLSMHNGAHHPSHPPPMNAPTNGALAHPNLANFTPQELLDYVRLINQEMRTAAATATSPTQVDLTLPNGTTNLTPLELQQRMSFYNWCNNNRTQTEPQKEPINLSESTSSSTVKREPENRESPPPPKRVSREGDERSNSHTPESVAPIHSTHIRINSRGDSRSGENSMVVSMELDGVTYQGVLFPISRPTQPIAMTN